MNTETIEVRGEPIEFSFANEADLMAQVKQADNAIASEQGGVLGTIGDIGQTALASAAELPLGATQIVTDALSLGGAANEGREVAQDFQTATNSEAQRLIGTGLPPLEAIKLAQDNVRNSGIVDPAAFNIEDVRRAQAGAARTAVGLKEDAAATSPIAGAITDVVTKGLQVAPLAPQGLVTGGATFLGLENLLRPNTTVGDPLESLTDRAIEGAKGAAIGAAGGKAFAVAAPVLVKGASKVTPLILEKAGAAANIVSGKTAEVVRDSANKLLAVSPQAARDALDTGIVSGVAQLSDRTTTKLVDKFLSKLPFASEFLEKNSLEAIGKIESQLSKLGGKDSSIQEAGTFIQKGAERFVDKFRNASGKLYDRLYNKLPVEAVFTINNVKNLKATQSSGIREGTNLAGRVDKSEATRFIDDIIDDASGAVSAGDAGVLPFTELRRWRTEVGNKLTNSLTAGEDAAALKQLYAALTDDIKVAATQAGKLKEFNRANDFYNKGINNIENNLSKLIKDGRPEQVFRFALQGTKEGGTRIDSIMKSLSVDERDVVRSTVLNNIGKAPVGAQAEGRDFSIGRFLTNWDTRISPEAKVALFGKESGKTRESIDTIVRVAKRLEDIERFGNPSGTAQQVVTAGLAGSFFVAPLSALSAAGTGVVASRLISNKNFVNWLAKNAVKKDLTKPSMAREIRQLQTIAKNNPDIATDIVQYINVTGLQAAERIK